MTRPVRREYVDGRFGQVHLRCAKPVRPGGIPLVCLHMSPMSGRVFEKFAAEMAENRPVFALDTPGFGMSDPPPAPPRIEDYAASTFAALDALGLAGPVDLIGYHTGAMTAVQMAADAGERVRRVIMIGAPILTPEERTAFAEHYRHRAPQADGSHVLRRWQGFYHHHHRPGVSVAAINDMFREALLGGNDEWWGHAAAFAHDLTAAMRRSASATLVLATGDDLETQTWRAEGSGENYRVAAVPGWGHGFLDHHAGEVAAFLSAWLDGPAGIVPPTPASALGPRYPAADGPFGPASEPEPPHHPERNAG
ncbi:alpha/beta hydrolase [Croceicoccus sp. BE223]|uniref:alpha/beta fold hydrolase n=1 Tax=Croceicoccus sp. BE223 TaxID=2817716 RepID=UPI002854AE2D|nr:alpha/beta hydrolase [Croceicoccus sp. BE223]MDR7101191.1 pimeloyl-ACP methyl ester carboxylesterase [Croceicoccus sp. BE223]